MNVLKEDLIKARAKIEAGWCQGAFARDKDQHPADALSVEAVSFCVIGAVLACTDDHIRALHLLLRVLNADGSAGCLSTFNDAPSRTKDEVLALFDKTIARMEGAEST